MLTLKGATFYMIMVMCSNCRAKLHQISKGMCTLPFSPFPEPKLDQSTQLLPATARSACWYLQRWRQWLHQAETLTCVGSNSISFSKSKVASGPTSCNFARPASVKKVSKSPNKQHGLCGKQDNSMDASGLFSTAQRYLNLSSMESSCA